MLSKLALATPSKLALAAPSKLALAMPSNASQFYILAAVRNDHENPFGNALSVDFWRGSCIAGHDCRPMFENAMFFDVAPVFAIKM